MGARGASIKSHAPKGSHVLCVLTECKNDVRKELRRVSRTVEKKRRIAEEKTRVLYAIHRAIDRFKAPASGITSSDIAKQELQMKHLWENDPPYFVGM